MRIEPQLTSLLFRTRALRADFHPSPFFWRFMIWSQRKWKNEKKGKPDKVGIVRWDLVRKKYICKLLWVLRWPSPSLSVTGRSKRVSGTERAASCGLEDGQMWWVASVPGTKTSCRMRPCRWGSKTSKKAHSSERLIYNSLFWGRTDTDISFQFRYGCRGWYSTCTNKLQDNALTLMLL